MQQSSEPGDWLTIEELEKRSGESTRTIRYYMLNGLLSGPVGQGSAARYPAGHAARLKQIRALQDEGRQLASIRTLLEGVSDDDLNAGRWQPPPRTSKSGPGDRFGSDNSGHPDGFGGGKATYGSPDSAVSRSQWERFELEPGVELHVRRPLSTGANRRVQRMIRLAQEYKGLPLFEEEV